MIHSCQKIDLLMDAICVSFLFCQQLRSSAVSVVFVFNASLSDVAPASLILAAVDLIKNGKVLIVDVAICVLFLLCVNNQDEAL